MDHTANKSALEFLPDSNHNAQTDASTSNCTTVIEHGSGPSIDPERAMPQAITLNPVLGSHVPTAVSRLMPNFFTYNSQIESLTSSFTANNSVSSDTLLQDTRLENAYYGFPFCMDLDFPILTGEPVVEVDFDMVDTMLPNIEESPLPMGSMFAEVPRAHIAVIKPASFGTNNINNTLNSPTATGQSIISHMDNGQHVLGPTTAGSYVSSSRDLQPIDGIAKVINTSLKHSNRVKHLTPRQLPTHRSYPPGSSSTGNKHRLPPVSYFLIHIGLARIVVKNGRALIIL